MVDRIIIPEAWMKWIPVVDSLLLQCYYRVLSFISIHAPIDEVFKAARYLAREKRGGKVFWVVPDRVARWDNVEVFPGITMTVWIFGSKIRRKNTVMARRGWWALYLFDPFVKTMATILGARGTSELSEAL